jgi:hypothetical protein
LHAHRFVSWYGGWLLPAWIVDKIKDVVYVCTAVDVPTVAYRRSGSRRLIAVSLIGDPTQRGPQLNDGQISKQARQITSRTASVFIRFAL